MSFIALLACGPRQRLDAEIIRDNALAVAGILNPALGGKSIKPAQPAGTWEINEMSGYNYDKSKGAAFTAAASTSIGGAPRSIRPSSRWTRRAGSSASHSARKPARPCNRSCS